LTYFCECFVCGSAHVCSHREPELVAWWREAIRQHGEMVRFEYLNGLSKTRAPVAVTALRQIATPSEVATLPAVQIEAPEPALKRKPFSRAEALRISQYSAVRGW